MQIYKLIIFIEFVEFINSLIPVRATITELKSFNFNWVVDKIMVKARAAGRY